MKYLIIPFAIILLLGCNTDTRQNITEEVSSYYQEPYRPQIHFSPEEMWMNDPNGLVYYEGEYHLFYQYYPDSTVWGPMHWGHAVSPDMVNWEHLPIALYPDSLGYIFSGSAVVDWKNTSGLGTETNPPLIAIFTHHDPVGEKEKRIDFQYQSIAYSLDKGRNWTKYENNPVVPNPGIRDFRDPKVRWDDGSQQWIMIFAADDRVRIYSSPNLIEWTFASEFGAEWGSHGGVWECPDLFPLAVNGDPSQIKWVMLLSINPGGPNGGSATQYFVGDFDGQTFTLDPEFAPRVAPTSTDPAREQAVWLDYGPDNYAGVTFSDVPDEDGRRLFLGWMSNWAYAQVVPTEAWRSAMTMPRSLSLIKNAQGWWVCSTPVTEIANLHSGGFEVLEQLTGDQEITAAIPGQALPLEINLQASSTKGTFGLKLYNDQGENLSVGYDPVANRYFIDRRAAGPDDFSENFAGVHYAPKKEGPSNVDLTLIIDVSSIELFADDGATVMTSIFFPSESFNHVALFAEGVGVEWQKVEGRSLKGIW